MATQVQWRGGSTAEHATFTGAAREVTVDTQKQTLVLHDGSTAGGRPLLREDGSNAALALGSAGTPSLKFTGDTNTGLYSPGADQVAISTNGTGRLFVNSSGSVGIGASSPQTYAGFGALTLNGSTGSTLRLEANGTNALIAQASSATDCFISAAAAGSSLAFQTAATERMRLDSSGRLGLGTSSPSSILHVSGTAGTPVVFERTSTTGTFIALKDSASQTFIGNTNGVFSIQTPGSSYSDKLVVTSAGNVGIGTTPSAKLHVNTGTNENLWVGSLGGSGAGIYLASVNDSGSANTPLQIGSAYDIRLAINGTEAARVDSSRRLLVGTSSTRTLAWWDTPHFLFEGLDYQKSGLCVYNNQNEIYGAVLSLGHSRGTSIGSNTVLQSGDYIGTVSFYGSDGSNEIRGAEISAFVDGTPGTNDMPGRLVFSTTADGASSPTERMRIDSTGLMTLAGPGIKFPATQVASADPNTLDDYEEGSWTPTQAGGVTAVGTFSSVGNYIKVGRQVSFAGYITATTSVAFNPAGGGLVGGLPFSVLAGVGCGVAQNAIGSVMIVAIPGGTGISGQSSVAATSVIYFSGTYPT